MQSQSKRGKRAPALLATGILQEMRVPISRSGDMNHNGNGSKGDFQGVCIYVYIYLEKRGGR